MVYVLYMSTTPVFNKLILSKAKVDLDYPYKKTLECHKTYKLVWFVSAQNYQYHLGLLEE